MTFVLVELKQPLSMQCQIILQLEIARRGFETCQLSQETAYAFFSGPKNFCPVIACDGSCAVPNLEGQLRSTRAHSLGAYS